VTGLTVHLPAAQILALAQRKDVLSISPNRSVYRTSSTLEAITGATTSQVRSYVMPGAYVGLDGTGVGIAVLDSGIMKAHRSFANAYGVTRVRRSVDMLKARGAIWSSGFYDGSMSYTPGATGLQKYESLVANDAKPIMKATKCDLCLDQYGGPACERACPHDALKRINLNTLDEFAAWLHR